MKEYILGVDIGTSNSKGIISDLEGTIVSSSSITHTTSMPHKCRAEHDAIKVWWNDFKKICAEVLNKAHITDFRII